MFPRSHFTSLSEPLKRQKSTYESMSRFPFDRRFRNKMDLTKYFPKHHNHIIMSDQKVYDSCLIGNTPQLRPGLDRLRVLVLQNGLMNCQPAKPLFHVGCKPAWCIGVKPRSSANWNYWIKYMRKILRVDEVRLTLHSLLFRDGCILA
jgi:hypothetical protein